MRRLEEYGAEAWLSDITEWIWYTISEHFRKLKLKGRQYSLDAPGAWMRKQVQKRDEHVLLEPFRDDFVGYEEPDIYEVLEAARPYLPREGAFGEMVLNVGKAVYLAKKGADGIIDISPFTCMNGIVCEAIYPRISRDLGGIPIRNFYFDGTQIGPRSGPRRLSGTGAQLPTPEEVAPDVSFGGVDSIAVSKPLRRRN